MVIPTEFGTRRIRRDGDLPGQFDGEIGIPLIVVRGIHVERRGSAVNLTAAQCPLPANFPIRRAAFQVITKRESDLRGRFAFAEAHIVHEPLVFRP